MKRVFSARAFWRVAIAIIAVKDVMSAQDERNESKPPLALLGIPRDPNYPASVYPLGLCEGDCNGNSHCQEGLVCFLRDEHESVPGCESGGSGDIKGKDYCIDPEAMKTPSPSTSPTLQPTVAPTLQPTVAPTNVAKTSKPTSQPSSSSTPQTSGSPQKEIVLRFSLWRGQKSITQDMDIGVNLVDAVLASILHVICGGTDFLVVTKKSDAPGSEWVNHCASKPDDFASLSLVSRQLVPHVMNAGSDELQWTAWEVTVAVEQVGDGYMGLADSILRDSYRRSGLSHDSNGAEQDVHIVALRLMESTANAALAFYIQDGQLDTIIGGDVKTSEPGKEETTFIEESQTQEPLDPEVWSSMRITGIFMLFALATFYLLVAVSATARKQQRELEKEVPKDDLGGLATEAGLALILDTGRSPPNLVHEAKSHQSSSSQDSTKNRLSLVLSTARNKSLLGPIGIEDDEQPESDMFSEMESSLSSSSDESPLPPGAVTI